MAEPHQDFKGTELTSPCPSWAIRGLQGRRNVGPGSVPLGLDLCSGAALLSPEPLACSSASLQSWEKSHKWRLGELRVVSTLLPVLLCPQLEATVQKFQSLEALVTEAPASR